MQFTSTVESVSNNFILFANRSGIAPSTFYELSGENKLPAIGSTWTLQTDILNQYIAALLASRSISHAAPLSNN